MNPLHARRCAGAVSVCLSLLLIAGGLFALARPAASVSAQGDASSVINAVNTYRAAHGLPPLQTNAVLMAAAQGHASWIAATSTFSHTGANGSSPQDRATAAGYPGRVIENFVSGSGMTPQGAVTWWDGSPIHKQGMLSTLYVEVGAGYAVIGDQQIYVMVFGYIPPPTPTPRPSSPGETAPEPEEPEEPAGPPVVPLIQSPPREDGSVVHVVQQGQTMWDIAAVYQVSIDELLALNYLEWGELLHPGDEVLVKLGPGQTPPPPPEKPSRHLVQEGETIWEIAVLNDLTVDELLDLNGMTREDVLVPGTEILIRPDETTATAEPTQLPAPETTGG